MDKTSSAAMRACLLLAVSACGRLDFNASPAPGDPGGDAFPERNLTMVDGLSALPAGPLDLGVTGTPTGFTVTFTTAAGSDMYGVKLGGGMQPDADWRSTSASNKYVGTSMTWTGSPMTTMTTDQNLTYIKRYVADLSSYTQMDMQNGLGAKPTYAAASSRWFYAIVDRSVLHLREMASDGTPVGNVMDVSGGGPAGAPIGGALGGDGAYLYAIWSHTEGTCAWAMANIGVTISPSSAAVAATCRTPRLAVEPGQAVAVFDDGGAVQAIALAPGTGASAAAPIATGTAARIAHASAGGFWIAWQTGSELRVATYAPGQAPAAEASVAVAADLQAYELVAADDHSYLFAIANRALWWAQLD
jgi:hypothetical protein